jgi:hypothetical protein
MNQKEENPSAGSRAKLSKKTAPSKSEKKTFSKLTKENQTNIYSFDFTKDEGTTFK